jgi:hypothetical protein
MVEAAAAVPPRSSAAARGVAKCLKAYRTVYNEQKAKGMQPATAHHAGDVAYRLAMPTMENLDSIRVYIACVAQGMNLQVFSGREVSQMLYAAQVALTMVKIAGKEAQDDKEAVYIHAS